MTTEHPVTKETRMQQAQEAFCRIKVSVYFVSWYLCEFCFSISISWRYYKDQFNCIIALFMGENVPKAAK